MSPTLLNLVRNITIPIVSLEDKLVWQPSTSGEMSLKYTFLHKANEGKKIGWAKLICKAWYSTIKSLLAWRLMHDIIPTYEKLMERGYSISSMCSSCLAASESTHHIFFRCSFAIKLWSWLATILNISLQFQSIEDIWKLCERMWTPQ